MLLTKECTAMRLPRLSIVIAAVNGAELLQQTIDAIDAQPERLEIELVVVATAAISNQTIAELKSKRITVVETATEDDSIPKLRYRGIMAASGDLIAILEDHVEVAPDWAATVFQSMADPTVSAVGGCVAPGQHGWVNWGVFLADYARYIGPVPEGEYADLPGNNIAYRRTALLPNADALNEGKWESWVNDRLVQSGHRLVSTNRMVVKHCKGFRLGEFLQQRWHFGRSYAGMRNPDLGPLKRAVYGVGSSILPFLLTLRATKLIAGRDVPRRTLLQSWPLIALVMTVGAAGECAGYLFGPGNSLEQVR